MHPAEAAAMMLFFILMLAVFPALVLRYRSLNLRHRERMEAIERGVLFPTESSQARAATPAPAVSFIAESSLEINLLRGLKWSFVGLAISAVLFYIPPIVGDRPQWRRLDEMRGLSELHYTHEEIREAMRENDKTWNEERLRLRGLAALGLIPTAVGIAYLVFYSEQKRRPALEPPPVQLARADQ